MTLNGCMAQGGGACEVDGGALRGGAWQRAVGVPGAAQPQHAPCLLPGHAAIQVRHPAAFSSFACQNLALMGPMVLMLSIHLLYCDVSIMVSICSTTCPKISPYCHVAQADCIPLWMVELACHPLPNPLNCMTYSDGKQIPKTRRLQETAIDTGLGLLTSRLIVEFVLGRHASKAAVALQVGRADGGWRSPERHTLPPQPQCNAGRPQTRCCRYGPAPL